jgi:hypothetical protein
MVRSIGMLITLYEDVTASRLVPQPLIS